MVLGDGRCLSTSVAWIIAASKATHAERGVTLYESQHPFVHPGLLCTVASLPVAISHRVRRRDAHQLCGCHRRRGDAWRERNRAGVLVRSTRFACRDSARILARKENNGSKT